MDINPRWLTEPFDDVRPPLQMQMVATDRNVSLARRRLRDWLTTDGDAFAELVAAEQLGVVVPAQDPAALAAALQRVLYDGDFAAGCRDRIAAVAQRFTWETVLAPLVEFCRHPRPAPDRLLGTPLTAPDRRTGVTGALRRDAALARSYLAAGGPSEVARRAAGRLRRWAKPS